MFPHHRLRKFPDRLVAITLPAGGRDRFAKFPILQNNQIYEKTFKVP
jgi:hypothetical protein